MCCFQVMSALRSGLTVLGIVFGVAAVISMLAVGEGSSRDAQERIQMLGATNIIVRSVKPSDDSASAQKSWVTTYGLVKKDLDRFGTFGDSILRIVPLRPPVVELLAGFLTPLLQ